MAVRMMTSEVFVSRADEYVRVLIKPTGVLALLLEELLDLVANLTVWDLDIVLGVTTVGHEGQEAIIGDVELYSHSQPSDSVQDTITYQALAYQLVLFAGDVWDVHVVGRWRQIFHLLASEDVDGDQVDLGVAVLASLGGGHFDDLAWAALDDDVTVLPQGRALHWEGHGGASIGAVEGDFMLRRRYYQRV